MSEHIIDSLSLTNDPRSPLAMGEREHRYKDSIPV